MLEYIFEWFIVSAYVLQDGFGFQVLYREAVGAMKIYKAIDMIIKFNVYRKQQKSSYKNIYTKYKTKGK